MTLKTPPAAQPSDRPYAETLRCPAGALCLDFCNTGQGAREPRHMEWISDFGDLVGWLEAEGALTADHALRLRHTAEKERGAASKVWRRAIRFRETLFDVVNARAADGTAAGKDLTPIETEFSSTVPYARLSWTGSRFEWSLDRAASTLDAVMQPLVNSAVSLLTSEKLARLRRCGNSTCYWLFIDETKNRSRRWCEMASCGNVNKVRRHRERMRSAPTG